MLKANITYTVINEDNELEMYANYVLNVTELPVEEFIKWVRDNANKLCEDCCYDDCGISNVDFVGVQDITFEDVEF